MEAAATQGSEFMSKAFMKVKKIVGGTLLGPLLLASLVAGCGSPRRLQVAVTSDYPPFCVQEPSGPGWQGRGGFDVILLQRLAKDLGWTLRPVNF
jgi:ABC-type amino acid transport substrate-binding protein